MSSVRSGWKKSIDRLASRPRTGSAARMVRLTEDGLGLEFFYAGRGDPYGVGASKIEAAKYERTVETLGARRFGSVFEVGCAAGVLSERLAYCKELGAVDVLAVAAPKARRRLETESGAEARRVGIPRRMADGSFDLIACSDIFVLKTAAHPLGAAAFLG